MMNRNIETKESQERACGSLTLQGCKHNDVLVLQNQGRTAVFNLFTLDNGAGDPMVSNSGSRIGDQITLKGVSIKMFLENPVDRCNTYDRIMVIRGAKGDTFSRANLFKGKSANNLMDVLNTERFTVTRNDLLLLHKRL
jgi:hypothetical protein